MELVNGKLEIENDLKAIRYYGNKAISRKDFGFNQWDCHAFARNDGRSALLSRQLGFTLAEILIVLTIIGVMAVMTIPSLMQNANSQQKITMFKKGFNALSNAYATQFATKTPPSSKDDAEGLVYELSKQLNIKYYVNANTGEKYFSYDEIKKFIRAWRVMVTEDGIGYVVSVGQADKIPTKLEVNEQKSTKEMTQVSSIILGVIIDKAYKESDRINCNDVDENVDKQDLNKLKCNVIWFPISKEGITAGNPDCTIAGRIISDNTTYDATKCAAQQNP